MVPTLCITDYKTNWILWTGNFIVCKTQEQTPHSFCVVALTWFQFSRYVNSQYDKFLTLILDTPLHDITVDVWCAICATKITGPTFFFWEHRTQQYVTHILARFLPSKYNFLIQFYALFSEYVGDRTEERDFGLYIHQIKPYATLLWQTS